MIKLSPQAQAVLDAATMGNANVINNPVYKQCIAAALRAAANGLREAYANEEYADPADDWLDGIATELEGTNGNAV